jgi:ArsR family metal-binding transcriptional regulator
MTEEFFHGYSITRIMDCYSNPNKLRVMAETEQDIGDIFPYLNAILPNASYTPGLNILALKLESRLITLYPRLVMMTKIDDEDDARAILAWLRGQINAAHAHREEITPCYDRRRVLGVLDVYRLLPTLNCQDCGEITCMAFAVGLLEGRHDLQECQPLAQPDCRERRERLADLLGTAKSPPEEHA